jgi:hypothetical protein
MILKFFCPRDGYELITSLNTKGYVSDYTGIMGEDLEGRVDSVFLRPIVTGISMQFDQKLTDYNDGPLLDEKLEEFINAEILQTAIDKTDEIKNLLMDSDLEPDTFIEIVEYCVQSSRQYDLSAVLQCHEALDSEDQSKAKIKNTRARLEEQWLRSGALPDPQPTGEDTDPHTPKNQFPPPGFDPHI